MKNSFPFAILLLLLFLLLFHSFTNNDNANARGVEPTQFAALPFIANSSSSSPLTGTPTATPIIIVPLGTATPTSTSTTTATQTNTLTPTNTPTSTNTPTQTSTPTTTHTPTVTPTPSNTPTVTPTLPPQPTGNVIITRIFYDGVQGRQEPDEYVEIRNNDTFEVQLQGWTLKDEAGFTFVFPNFLISPGQTCRIYTNINDPNTCGFSFGRGSAIWNNTGDCGFLSNSNGVLMDEYCYSGN